MTWLRRFWADISSELIYLHRRSELWFATYLASPALERRIPAAKPAQDYPCCPSGKCCPPDCAGEHRTPCEECS